MPVWVRKLAVGALAGFPTLLILALLGGVAVWGARNDWKLPPLASLWGKEAAADKSPAEEAVKVVSGSAESGPPGPARVEFPSAEAVRKVGLRVVPVEVRDLARHVTANGMVDYEPSRYVRLTARSAGTIWRVYKEIGDPIHKGEVLALLDSAEVGKAKADFLQSLAQVKLRTTTLERLRSIGREGAVPDRSLREAEASVQEGRIRVFNDQQALLNLGLPVRLRDVEDLPDDQLVRRLRLLGLPEDVAREFDPETLTANLLPLTAPWDGQVVERNTAVGDIVEKTSPKMLFILADVRELHADLDVAPEDMAEVRVGQPVTFRTDGSGIEVRARVSHLSPEVDEKTRRVRVHAELSNPDGRLRPNAFGTGRILVGEHPHAVVVPAEAVQADGANHLVFVRLSETSFEARPVHPGLRQGDLVEVSELRPGEKVVTTGSFVLKSELRKDRITGGDE
jgi:cobalt-zinc-cadmium efflux system membrane fusion protein